MRLFIVVTLVIALLCALADTLVLPRITLTDAEINNYLQTHVNVTSVPGMIVSPPNYDTWYVGQHVNVTFKDEIPSETVSIFFFNQTGTLAGGPITQRTFEFVVPPDAVSGPNETSLLLAVRREDYYLHAVDAVIINVLPAEAAE